MTGALMQALARARKAAWQRAGHRGLFLFLTGCVDILVGSYLLVSGLPPAPNVLLIDESVWGVVWICMGAVLFTGVPLRQDRWQFAAAALLKMAWAGEFARLALQHGGGWLWVIAASWLLVAGVIMLVSSWPGPPP